MEGKQKTFISHLFLTTFLGGLIGILNYAFNIIIARYTSQEIFGTFSAALGIIYLTQISAVAIQSFITKTVAKNKENNLNKYKWDSLIIFSLIGLISSIVFFILKVPVSQLASIPQELILYLAIAIIFAFASPVSKGLLLGEERIVTVNLLLLGETILKFVIGVIAIKMGGNIPLLILANSLPAMLSTIIIIPLLKYKNRNDILIKSNWKEFILMTIAFLLLTTPFTIDLVLVNSDFRAEYSSLSLLGKIIYFACITTAGVMFARLSNEKNRKEQKRSLLLAIGLSALIGVLLSIIYFLFGNYVVSLSVGEEYLEINKYLGVFGLCMTGYSIVYMIANYFITKETYSYIFVLLGASILQIVLFSLRNYSLDIAVQNQIILYTVLTFVTIVFLLFNFKNLYKNGETNDKGEVK